MFPRNPYSDLSRPTWRRFAVSVSALAIALLFGAAPTIGQTATALETGGPPPSPVLGAIVEPTSTGPLAAEGLQPLLVTLTARWDAIERTEGTYDWETLRAEVRRLHAAGHPIALLLTGPHPDHLPDGGLPRPEAGDSLSAWLSFVRSAARTFSGQVRAYQIWEGPAAGTALPSTERYAFLVKSSALALRAEAAKSADSVLVAQTGIRPTALEWQRALWEQDVAAYIDVIPFILAADRDPSASLAAFIEENVRHPPASRVWVVVEPTLSAGGSPGAAALGAAIAALVIGADVAAIDLREVEDPVPQMRWILGAQAVLAEDRAPAPLGDVRVEDADGRPIEGARVLGRFFSDRDFSTLIFYLAPGEDEGLPRDRLVVDDAFVRDAYVLDPVDGSERRAGTAAIDGGRAIRVARGRLPLAVRYRRAAVSPGFELPPEEVETSGTREPTAEEIIARYQAVQRTQDDRLERFSGRGLLQYHFRLTEGGSSIDVGVESNYFWERGGTLEWEQVAYYINGAKTRWKKFPQLPLIQPEKVITLPLDLTLDRTYAYRKVGRGKVKGREAWVLAFEPNDPDAPASLYRGRIWIDAESFVRLKLSLVQTGLEVPVLANEETDLYEPHTGPDGVDYWLLTRVDGQQTWNTVGRTFVVQRELTFSDFDINPDAEAFAARREAAYASKNTMMADTDEGFRYLTRNDDGSRTVKTKVSNSQLFVVAGALKDGATDGVRPLAGVNYFNYNLGGKKVQINALFAGVLGLFTASKPDLIGKRGDLTADAFLTAIKFEDRYYEAGEELEQEAVRRRPQVLNLRLGFPIGQFWKFNLTGGIAQNRYFESNDGNDAIADFNAGSATRELTYVLPQDHTLLRWGGQLEFNRRGYTVSVRGSVNDRSEWDTFGLVDVNSGDFGSVSPTTGEFVVSAPEPVFDRFYRWRATAFKEWYLPHFQKARFELNYLDGEDLDRFSRYGFSQFGATRLNGFSGSGVNFDEGFIARGGYSFSIGKALQLNGNLDTAWVERRDVAIGTERFTGVGISGNIPAPWRTIVNLSVGYSIASDIPELEGETEFLLLVFKLF